METTHHLDKKVLGSGQGGNIIREIRGVGMRSRRGKMAQEPDKRMAQLWMGNRN